MTTTAKPASAFPLDRRRFLGLAGAAALFPSGLFAASAPDGVPSSRRRMIQMSGYASDAETPLDALTSYLTPNDLFFVRNHWNPMYPSRKGWGIAVDGEVERPLRLSLEDLRKMPRTTVTCVLQCAGNGRALFRPAIPGVQWKYGAVGNARWTGVRVKDILERAGLKASARHLHTFGSDRPPVKVPPFHRSVELDKVLADGIVADEMNGEPLPSAHGGPARLVVPGWAGDHWMKWLERLSPQPDPQTGFYMDTAYRYPKEPGAPGVAVPAAEMRPVTEIFVKSCFTDAPARTRAGVPVVVRGFAFSGAPDVARVDISDDDGATWRTAELDAQHDAWAWRLWSFRWTPPAAGAQRILARATDSRGAVQPREGVWNPSGYLHNGWHAAAVEVTA
ncbi:MAG: sulfite oxidase [Acidobacteriota bacterium]